MDKALHTIIAYCVSVTKFELSNLSFDFLIYLEGDAPPPNICDYWKCQFPGCTRTIKINDVVEYV